MHIAPRFCFESDAPHRHDSCEQPYGAGFPEGGYVWSYSAYRVSAKEPVPGEMLYPSCLMSPPCLMMALTRASLGWAGRHAHHQGTPGKFTLVSSALPEWDLLVLIPMNTLQNTLKKRSPDVLSFLELSDVFPELATGLHGFVFWESPREPPIACFGEGPRGHLVKSEILLGALRNGSCSEGIFFFLPSS